LILILDTMNSTTFELKVKYYLKGLFHTGIVFQWVSVEKI
jgi:hypothetical protein